MSPKKNESERRDILMDRRESNERKTITPTKPAKKLMRCGFKFYYVDDDEDTLH